MKAVFEAASQGAGRKAVKVERPGRRPGVQRPTRVRRVREEGKI